MLWGNFLKITTKPEGKSLMTLKPSMSASRSWPWSPHEGETVGSLSIVRVVYLCRGDVNDEVDYDGCIPLWSALLVVRGFLPALSELVMMGRSCFLLESLFRYSYVLYPMCWQSIKSPRIERSCVALLWCVLMLLLCLSGSFSLSLCLSLSLAHTHTRMHAQAQIRMHAHTHTHTHTNHTHTLSLSLFLPPSCGQKQQISLKGGHRPELNGKTAVVWIFLLKHFSIKTFYIV